MNRPWSAPPVRLYCTGPEASLALKVYATPAPFSATLAVVALVKTGARVSTGCTLCAAATLGLPAASVTTPAPTFTPTLPSTPASGVTTSVYTRPASPDTVLATSAPLLPPTTATSSAEKPVTASLNVKV